MWGMIERKVSTTSEARERYRKSGVVVFIFNPNQEVLLIEENTAKAETDKKKGTVGTICGTSENGENWEQTLIRELSEELGLNQEQIHDNFVIDQNNCYLGECLFVDDVLARVISVFCLNPSVITNNISAGDGEVSLVGWEKIENLIHYPLRSGVKNVLSNCEESSAFSFIQTIDASSLVELSLDNLYRLSDNIGSNNRA